MKAHNMYSKEQLIKTVSNISGVTQRNISADNQEIFIFYISQLTDTDMLSEFVIKPILEFNSRSEDVLTADMAATGVLSVSDCTVCKNSGNELKEYILNGYSIVIFQDCDKSLAVNTKKVEKRSIPDPELTYTLRGPKDSFTENLDDNLSLIRYRIKDPGLNIDLFELGRRTKTRVGMLFIKDIANEKYVTTIRDRISKVEPYSLFESGFLQKILLNRPSDMFPQTGLVERSDMACAGLLEGRIIILVEGSGIALMAPVTIADFLKSGDDIYDNRYLSVFIKFLRIIAISSSLTLSSLYVAVVTFNPEILPAEYVLTVAKSRATVPFNAFFEALVMEFIAEVIREAIIRLPKQIGPAIGIAGAIVIGQAAVSAGVFSPLMIIIGSMSLVSSFAAPDYTIINPLRILKFMMISLTGFWGLFGFVMGITLITINMVSNNSFGMPFFAPFAPWNFYDMKSFFLSDVSVEQKRPNFLNTTDKTKK